MTGNGTVFINYQKSASCNSKYSAQQLRQQPDKYVSLARCNASPYRRQIKEMR